MSGPPHTFKPRRGSQTICAVCGFDRSKWNVWVMNSTPPIICDDERLPFLVTIKAEPDNLLARLIYADFLNDRGYYEEEAYQREYVANARAPPE